MNPTKTVGPGIIGVGKYLPAMVRPNSYFSDPPPQGLGLETSDEWIVPRVGIRNRHVAAEGELTSDLAVYAAKEALEMAQMTAAQLGQIIVATATPDCRIPSTANYVQAKLDPKALTPAFDINNACNGGLAGMELGYSLVNSASRESVLVIGAETLTRASNYQDRTSCVLFGDGAGAVVIGLVENPGPFGFVMKSDGTGAEDIIIRGGGHAFPTAPQYIELDGKKVFKGAVKCMSAASEEVLQLTGVKKEDVTWFIPHQANQRIIDGAAERLGLQDRTFSYIEDIGNISAASILVAMSNAYRDGWLQQGDILLLAAIGSGLNYGAGVVQWNVPNPTPRPAGKFADYKGGA